jgi:transcriptional regulator with XRE-family HTH domain
MHAIRIGLSLRALRLRRRLRQIDVAIKAGVSRGTVSNIERGLFQHVSIETLERVAAVVGAGLDIRVRWHGADLDRLLDDGHARLGEAITRRLRAAGWDVAVEATFSAFGERGSIDVLAWHRESGCLLVVEVKTVVPDFQAMLSGLDRKARLGPDVAKARGWTVRSVSRLLVIEEGTTSRNRLSQMASTIDAVLPDRGPAIRPWMRSPNRGIAGVLFVRSATPDSVTGRMPGRQRVRRQKSAHNATGTGNR